MFKIIEDQTKSQFPGLLDRMHQLRKEVFYDRLKWDVAVGPQGEFDAYDDMNPAYLVWCDETETRLYGSLRLLPTTGPTLLYDVFRDTFPNDVSLTAPGIWEGTRLCIDEELIAWDMPRIDSKKAFCMMLLALCEAALIHGIHTLISNYEPPTKRLYSMAGAPLVELGRAGGFGKRPVCAGSFEVSREILVQMRNRLDIHKPLVTDAAKQAGFFEPIAA